LAPASSNGVYFHSREATSANKPQLVLAVSSTDAPPETQIDTGPPTLTSSNSATFTFSANEPVTFACSLDGAPFSACASGTTYTGLQNGGHSFQVQATDQTGNTDPTPASWSWQVDTVVPAVTSTVPQNGATNVDRSTVLQAVFSEPMDPASIDGSAFELEESGAGPVAGTVAYNAGSQTATFTPANPLPAPATLTAKVTTAARDPAGNTLAADVVWTFTTTLVNHAPTVNAGPDQTITLPANAALDGTVSDDGLPSPPSLTTTWSQLSGPGTATFGDASQVDTSASFTDAGSYVLQLQAFDGELTTSDTVTVTVNQAPSITSNGGGPTAAVSTPENQTAVTDVDATDPDAGDTVSYSIVPGADAARFT
ncbi:MAG: Ig-like domain-containing protein, partial [Nocardioidaceae bacterium]